MDDSLWATVKVVGVPGCLGESGIVLDEAFAKEVGEDGPSLVGVEVIEAVLVLGLLESDAPREVPKACAVLVSEVNEGGGADVAGEAREDERGVGVDEEPEVDGTALAPDREGTGGVEVRLGADSLPRRRDGVGVGGGVGVGNSPGLVRDPGFLGAPGEGGGRVAARTRQGPELASADWEAPKEGLGEVEASKELRWWRACGWR
mmetsp:Transcript_18931/g.60476  ORF Transcript_18931/g.60476 Transcript_18931/m.60476 type:complete len:204 (-) Transcript_18931:2202-2813(-)